VLFSIFVNNILKTNFEGVMKSMIRIITLSLLSVLLFISCKEDQPNNPSDTEISYSTSLIDNNSYPVINAIVSIYEIDKNNIIATDTSDENGNISFLNVAVPSDNIIFSISHPLYNTLNLKYSEIENKENGTVTLEDKEDCCGSVELSIKDEDGNALKNVEVKVRQDMKVLKKGKSDENGNVKFDGLCLEQYEFRLAIDGFKVIEELVSIENCDETLSLNFKMVSTQSEEDTCCDGVFIFKPKDENGEILNGTKVYIYKDGKVIEDPIVENGKATADGLCEGKYTIVYKRDGYENKEVQVEIGCDEEKTLEHTLEKKSIECCEGKVKLIVKDENGNVLKNAAVRLWKGSKKLTELKTDANGYVEFKELCESDEYSISIFADGYEELEFEFDLDCNKELSFEKTLTSKEDCCEAVLKFIVKDAKTKSVIKDAKITLKLDGKVIFEKRATNAEGIVIEDGLCKGKYTVIIERDGYERIETSWNIEKCDDFQETFWMNNDDDCCNSVLIFKTKDKDGNILNGTKVYIYKDGKLIEDPVIENGKATIDGLCEGKYTIVYKKEGYTNKEVQVEVGCDQEKTLEQVLEKSSTDCCEGIVRVKIRDSKGNIIQNASVRLWKGSTKLKELKTNTDGLVEFKELCESNDYSLSISAEGYEGMEFAFDLDCNKEISFEKALSSITDCCEAILKFIVKDNETKSAIEGAKITLKLNGKVIYEKKATNKEGGYLAKELCKGKYTVIIEKDGYNTIETTWNVEKCDTFQEHFWMKK
jgi:protocatechuate 3,4-dioxygenase beta subunit